MRSPACAVGRWCSKLVSIQREMESRVPLRPVAQALVNLGFEDMEDLDGAEPQQLHTPGLSEAQRDFFVRVVAVACATP
eukprot:4756974-Lingulodinium_polyedra.AAC.1